MANQVNNRNSGDVGIRKASTVFAVGDILTVDGSGLLVPGGSGKPKGISNEQVLSSAPDYATAGVQLNYTGFKHDDLFIFPVTTGTAVQAMVGTLVDIDSNPQGVNVNASTNKQVEVVQIINSTTIKGRFVVQTA